MEHYMFPELAQSDVVLTNTRGMLGDLVADHAFALILSLARELHIYMRQEFERIGPVMASGRYFPGCDHQTPPGVPLENYHTYLKLFEEYATKAVERW